jgi:hypothetical protein
MKVLVRKIARLLVVATLGLMALEVAARIDDLLRFGADPVAYYGPKNLVTTGDTGLTFNRPDVRYEKWRHDARGFRVYPEAAKRTFSTQWTCVGSSESYGLYERPAGEWPSLLDALVAPDGIRVDNASVVGISPFELPWYLDQHVLPYRPDCVLLIINPFIFMYGMTISGAAPDSAHFADPARLERMRVARTPTLREQSRFFPKAQRSIIQRLPADWTRRLAIATKVRRLERLQRARDRSEVLLDAPPPAAVAAYVAMLTRLERQLASRGVALAMCTYPHSLSGESTLAARDAMLDRTLWLPSYTPDGLRSIANTFAAATRSFCAASDVALIDLEAAIPHDSENFADSVHLTDAGAQRAATEAATALRNRPARGPVLE